MKFIELTPKAIVPTRGTQNSAGYDLHALETGMIPPQRRRTIPTGISWVDVPNYIVEIGRASCRERV
jgi:dUTPase